MAKIMTTKEMSGYLKLHEITICKYAAQGKIPAIRIGRSEDSIKRLLIDGWEAVKGSLIKNARENEKDDRISVVYNYPIFKVQF